MSLNGLPALNSFLLLLVWDKPNLTVGRQIIRLMKDVSIVKVN